MSSTSRWKFGLAALCAVCVAVALYWPTLSLPLMFDDLLHIRLAEQVDFGTVWLPSERFGFYRPIIFLPFLIIEQLLGRYPAPLLHGFNVFQHALNCFLLTWLAWRLWHSWQRSLFAGVFLAAYPFAYQAVVLYGNHVYPLSGTIALGLLHLILSWLRQRRYRLLILLGFAIGLLSHETAVLVGPFAILLAWAQFEKDGNTMRDLTLPALLTALGGAYIIGYQFLPTGGGPAEEGTTALLPKLLYLAQTAVHPVAWFGGLGDSAESLFIPLGFVLLVVLSLWGWRNGSGRALLFGWGWWLLSAAVIGINLPTYYILHGARLVYLAGIGAALVWAIVFADLWQHKRWGPPMYSAALLFVLFIGFRFVSDRVAAFADIGAPVQAVAATMADKPAADGVVLVNLPAWTAPPQTTFPVGIEYVTLMGYHLFADEVVNDNLASTRPVKAMTVPDLLTVPEQYNYGLYDQAEAGSLSAEWTSNPSHIFINRYTDAGITTQYAGSFATAEPTPPSAAFDAYRLLSATVEQCGTQVVASLTWVFDGSPAPTSSIFAQVLNGDGVLVAQSDSAPLGLPSHSYSVPSGWQINERRYFDVGDATGATLLVGGYDFTTGERYAASDKNGTPLADNALRVAVSSCQSATQTP